MHDKRPDPEAGFDELSSPAGHPDHAPSPTDDGGIGEVLDQPIDPKGPLGKALLQDYAAFVEQRQATQGGAVRVPTDLDAYIDQSQVYFAPTGPTGIRRIRQLLEGADLRSYAEMGGDDPGRPCPVCKANPEAQLVPELTIKETRPDQGYLLECRGCGLTVAVGPREDENDAIKRRGEHELTVKRWQTAEQANPPEQGLWEAEVEQLEAMPIYGNHAFDSPAFEKAHRILTGDAEMPLKIRALKRIDDMTGCGDPANEEGVRLYLAENAEAEGLPRDYYEKQQPGDCSTDGDPGPLAAQVDPASWPKTNLEDLLDAGQLRARVAHDLARLVILVPQGDLRSLANTAVYDAAIVLQGTEHEPKLADLPNTEQAPTPDQEPLDGEEWQQAYAIVQGWHDDYTTKDWLRMLNDLLGPDWLRGVIAEAKDDPETNE